MDDAFEGYFGEHVEDIVDGIPDSFTKKELKYLSDEYDIEIEK
jgi:hypothetical protein